jgi:hypothetical protein
MSVRRFVIRAARKTAVQGNKVLKKASKLADKVEVKSTRILDGVDYSLRTNEIIPIDKIYYNTLPYVLPLHASMPAIGSNPTVTLLIPSLDGASFFGGTATALIVAAKFAIKKQRKLRIVQTLKTGHPGNLSEFFASEGIVLSEDDIQVVSVADRAYDRYGYVSMHPDDLFIASAWWDAQILSQMPLKNKFIYLVQDFEPIFYNNSDMYVLAEQTYKGDKFIALCNTQLMHDFMKKRNYPVFDSDQSYWFEPAVSRIKSGQSIKKQTGEKKKLFIYGRPNVHRNLFFSALNSLDLALKSGRLKADEWEFYMAGQDNIPDVKLSSGAVIKNLGKMSVSNYTEFSKSIDLAISLMMAPHPNYPTLEFASIGTTVVTTQYENKIDLSRYSENIIVSETGTEAIAESIINAAKRTYKQRMDSLSTTNIHTSWDESLDSNVTKITGLII